MDSLKKILVFGMTPNVGGLETYIIAQFRSLDKSRWKMDFISDPKNPSRIAFQDEIESNGSRVFELRNKADWISFMKTHHEYDLLVFNVILPTIPILRTIVKHNSFRRIIVHSHNGNSIFSGFLSFYNYPVFRYWRRFFRKHGIVQWACSKRAGDWMFGKDSDYTVIKNGINTEKFRFNPELRKDIRKSLGISDNTLVIGHVGRFAHQKRSLFLLDIIESVSNRNPDSVLLCIGDDNFEPIIGNEFKRRMKARNLSSKVILMGMQYDAFRFYNAMDCFVLPSRYEGFPIVGVEAQTSGLPCLFSDTITSEIKLTDNAHMLPARKANDADLWADAILDSVDLINDAIRLEYCDKVRSCGYDIEDEVSHVETLLFGLV